jgi:tetratricopeptide (TPR) repeat protein
VLLPALQTPGLGEEGQKLSPAAEALQGKIREYDSRFWFGALFPPRDIEATRADETRALADDLARLAREATDADTGERARAFSYAEYLYCALGDRVRALSTVSDANGELESKLAPDSRVTLARGEAWVYKRGNQWDKALEALDRAGALVPVPQVHHEPVEAGTQDIGAWISLQEERIGVLQHLGRAAEATRIYLDASETLCTLAQRGGEDDRGEAIPRLIWFTVWAAPEQPGDGGAVSGAFEHAADVCLAWRGQLDDDEAADAFTIGFLGRVLRRGSIDELKGSVSAYAEPFAGERWFGEAWVRGCGTVLPGVESYEDAWPDFPEDKATPSADRYQLLNLFVEKGWVPGDDERTAPVLFAMAFEEYLQGAYGAAMHRLSTIREKWPGYADEHNLQYSMGKVAAAAEKSGWPEGMVERLTAEAMEEEVASTDAVVSEEGAAEAAATIPSTSEVEGAANEEGEKGRGSQVGWWAVAAGLVAIIAAAVFVKRRHGASRK